MEEQPTRLGRAMTTEGTEVLILELPSPAGSFVVAHPEGPDTDEPGTVPFLAKASDLTPINDEARALLGGEG